MSQPGTIYRLNWNPFENVQMYVDISDNDNLIEDDETPEVIEVTPNGEAFILSVIDNDEDPFTVIRAQQGTIRFNSTDDINMSTFVSGSDERWGVHAYVTDTTKTIFRGFLQIADIVEDFMPVPNVVELTATDQLGSLKDIPLTDFTGANPKGKYRVGDFITWALSKTGLSLNLKAAFNIRQTVPEFTAVAQFVAPNLISFTSNPHLFEIGYTFTTTSVTNPGPFTVRSQNELLGQWVVSTFEAVVNEADANVTVTSNRSGHFFDNQYLDIKTFEDEIGKSIDCYSVLQRILGHEAALFQRGGYWWILRIDEVEDPTRGLYIYEFDTEGQFDTNHGEVLFDKTIEKPGDFDWTIEEDIFFSQEATTIGCDRPHKEVSLDYRYENPIELLCNIDIDRGTGDDVDPTLAEQTIEYVPDCWKFFRMFGDDDLEPDAGSLGVLRKVYEYGYEQERYLVAKNANPPNGVAAFRSERIRVEHLDKISFGVDVCFDTNIAADSMNPCLIRLYGDDGDIYNWKYNEVTVENEWVVSLSSTPWTISRTGEDTTEWRGVSAESKPVPDGGWIYIYLTDEVEDPVEQWFSNMTFDYIPLINGSYQKYRIKRQTVTQSGNYKAVRKEEVYISESHRQNFKGALMYISGIDELFSGDIFFDGNTLRMAEYLIGSFDEGQLIFINTSNNPIQWRRIVGVSTVTIIGTNTVIEVDGEPFVDGADTGEIYEAVFSLSTDYYNGAVYPTDPPDEAFNPFSEIQIFDVWNQFRNEMRRVHATCQGLALGTETDTAHLIHKWALADISEHTINRFFLLMTFEQRFFDCEWTGTIREVYNTTLLKEYTGRTLKYITE